MKKYLVITVAFLIGLAALGAGMYLGAILNGGSASTPQKSASSVSAVGTDGRQVIEITAKGGYLPKESTAKAGVPTVLRVVTDNTFDCSSSISIPSIGYHKNLPRTGSTDIEVPAQAAGTTLRGACSMGMYGFTVNFE
ncbi:MAG TPA: cupredoxin domain-containing protein [Candidatus Fimivivens sp.]|nr:cupredoxin domain-containing protein [Candidatus Fimivivens sp.]